MENKNNITIVYHASYKAIDEPSIIKGKFIKDFGYGFYCTRNKEQAKKWTKKFKKPVLNIYYLQDTSDLRIIKFEEYNE